MAIRSLNNILLKIIPEEHQWKLPIYTYWDQIVGTLKDKVILEKITNDSLVLLVCHPTWAQELFVLIPMLKQKVNDVLSQKRIRHIRFKTADFSLRKRPLVLGEDKKVKNDELSQQQALRYLDNNEQKQLRKIYEDDLREQLELYAFRCKRTMKNIRGETNGKKKNR